MIPRYSLRAAIAVLLLSISCTLPAQNEAQSQDHSQMDHSRMDHSAMEEAPKATPEENPMPAHGEMGHGDHNPKFGGLVLMYGVLHFEIVAKPSGVLELHLSDAMRTPMPAVTVSDVTIEVERDGGDYESVSMAISEAGDFWQGKGGPLTDSQNTTVHLAFVAYGDPYVYALPLSVLQPENPEIQALMETPGLSPAQDRVNAG